MLYKWPFSLSYSSAIKDEFLRRAIYLSSRPCFVTRSKEYYMLTDKIKVLLNGAGDVN